MANQFQPLGQASMRAHQANAELISSALQNANRIKAERAMQQQRIAAEQQMQMTSIAARQTELAQLAKQQAARDAQLNEYDMERIDRHFDRQIALKDYELTGGYSEGDIAKEAANLGISPSAYKSHLIETRRKADLEEEYGAKLDYFRNLRIEESSFQDQQRSKKLAEFDQSDAQIQEQLNSGKLRPAQAQEMFSSNEEARRQLLAPAKRPRSVPFEQVFKDNSYQAPNGDIVFKDPDTKKTTHIRVGSSGSSAEMRKDVDSFMENFLKVDDGEIGVWLDNAYSEAFKKDPSQGVWDKNIGEGGKGGMRAKTVQDAMSPAKDKKKAQDAIYAEKLRQAPMMAKEVAISKAATRWVFQGIEPEMARKWAEEEFAKMGTEIKAKRVQGDATQKRIEFEHLTSEGQPIPTSQPAPESQPDSQPAQDDGSGYKQGEVYEVAEPESGKVQRYRYVGNGEFEQVQ